MSRPKIHGPQIQFLFVTSMVSELITPHGHAPYQHNTLHTIPYGVV